MIRATRQNTVIRQILDIANGPLTPEDIFKQAKKTVPGIGLATIYRVLKQMIDEGQAVALGIPGSKPRYEKVLHRSHHHFICEKCGVVYRIDGEVRDIMNLTPEGFTPTSYEIFVRGDCGQCQREEPASRRKSR